MNLLIIVLVVAVVIGPIMYLVPNAKDKRLTKLRAEARMKGLTVKITSVPKLDPSASERVTAGGKTLDPKILCTAYQLPTGQTLEGVGTLLLCKLPANPTVRVNEVLPGWGLVEDPEGFWSQYIAGKNTGAQLLEALGQLPEDCLALGISERFVACYWREKSAAETDVVMVLTTALGRVRDDLTERFGSGRD